ncbi:MAG: hypothetical protein A07HR60_01693 [uncultured archaeon A07HR60]|jgi:hypothetical protein|nr:MAG: hypothetical protein A07HR60_01693 [uncultured archaeon A07HR60]
MRIDLASSSVDHYGSFGPTDLAWSVPAAPRLFDRVHPTHEQGEYLEA